MTRMDRDGDDGDSLEAKLEAVIEEDDGLAVEMAEELLTGLRERS